MSRKILVIAIASIAWLTNNTSAQQPPTRPNESGLALEIIYFKGTPPAYQLVPRSDPRAAGTWYARLNRIAAWHLPPGALPIEAVRIVPSMVGDMVSLKVSVLRGVGFHDAEDNVATYNMRESEQISITELENFGVEPFEIKVVRIAPRTTDPPRTLSNAKSLEVISTEAVVSTMPKFKVTLHNLSQKGISALRVNLFAEGRMSLSTLRQGKDGEPLIKAGDFWELYQPAPIRAVASPGGFTPWVPAEQQIVITALVFEDGSYEGDSEPAAEYRGFVAGNKTELKRLVPLLASAMLDPESTKALQELRSQLASLSYDIDEAEVAGLKAAFPSLKKRLLRTTVEVAMHSMRKDLSDELQRLQESQVSGEDFRSWLVAARDRYTNWLSRL